MFKLRKTEIDAKLIGLFNKKLTDKQIENVHQLVFVLCCPLIPKEEVSSYSVKALNGTWYELSGNWMLPFDNSGGLYNDCYILSTEYEEVRDLLKIRDGFGLFYGDENTDESRDYLFSHFRFRSGCNIEVFNEDVDTVSLLQELCECWKKTKKSGLINSKEWKWDSILHFNPGSKIYDSQNRIVAGEGLAPEITAWLEAESENLPFAVQALGLHSENSAILKLREGLLTGSKALEDVDIYSIDPLFLQNTLIGLADGFVNGQTIGTYPKNSKQFVVINSIIQRVLNLENRDIRVHVYTGLERFTLGSEKESYPFYLDQGMLELISKDNRNKPYLKNLFKKVQIVFGQDLYKEYVEETYRELEVMQDFIINEECLEHTEYYYKKWKEKTGIRLFRANSIWYKVSVEIDDISYELGEIERIGPWYHLDIEQKVLYYLKCIGLETLSELLKEDG
ncbi:MAG: hypothetical protein LUE98_01965 [Tannerellaceae bacterium]|nr:hypothetical protein [Tannerellaceae bacterium]